jgi:hypothetical protein
MPLVSGGQDLPHAASGRRIGLLVLDQGDADEPFALLSLIYSSLFEAFSLTLEAIAN